MADLDPMGHWLLLGVTAWISFMIGRATARRGGGSSEARGMADQQEIASATANLPPSVWADIDRLLAEKKKIEAIKLLREASGLGLKLSKDAVEQRAAIH
jgi:ribosomal protein L7/L12